MKTSSLAHRLISENAKTTKHVPGEIGVPSSKNINTPDNHVDGKKMKTADGHKGLGKRKDEKPYKQVTPPKKGHQKIGGKVHEAQGEESDFASQSEAQAAMSKYKNKYGGKWKVEPYAYQNTTRYAVVRTDRFNEMASAGAVGAAAVASGPTAGMEENKGKKKKKKHTIEGLLRDLNESIDGGASTGSPFQMFSRVLWFSMLRNGQGSGDALRHVYQRMNESQRAWLKRNKVAVETLARVLDQKTALQEAKHSPEEMDTPAVEKKSPASGGSIKVDANDKADNKGDPGMVKKLPDSYLNKNPVKLAKVIESVEELHEFLGDELQIEFFPESNMTNEKLGCDDDMGDWITDFRKSKKKQFKGKSSDKRRKMAIAARTKKCK